jgi:hypothetical protein
MFRLRKIIYNKIHKTVFRLWFKLEDELKLQYIRLCITRILIKCTQFWPLWKVGTYENPHV